MQVVRGRVARELAALEERLERALERVLDPDVRLTHSGDSFRSAVDVYETETATIVRAAVAGVRGEDVRLTVDGEYLQISGRRELRSTPRPQRHLKMEISEGHFERVLRVGVPYDRERVTAKLENGLLTIELPVEEPRVRRVPVRTE